MRGSAVPAAAKLADRIFFAQHHKRRFRIRTPIEDEYRAEFLSLGYHQVDRRRMIVQRVSGEISRRYGVDFLRVPVLLFADEAVEDADGPVAGLLRECLEKVGVRA